MPHRGGQAPREVEAHRLIGLGHVSDSARRQGSELEALGSFEKGACRAVVRQAPADASARHSPSTFARSFLASACLEASSAAWARFPWHRTSLDGGVDAKCPNASAVLLRSRSLCSLAPEADGAGRKCEGADHLRPRLPHGPQLLWGAPSRTSEGRATRPTAFSRAARPQLEDCLFCLLACFGLQLEDVRVGDGDEGDGEAGALRRGGPGRARNVSRGIRRGGSLPRRLPQRGRRPNKSLKIRIIQGMSGN